MKPHGTGETDIGRKRDANEDAFLVNDAQGLYIVCDGMGGHAAGEVAANLALEAVTTVVRAKRDDITAATDDDLHTTLVQIGRQAVRNACTAVYGEATTNPDRSGMGCTLTMLLIARGTAVLAHVGDTRLYLYRDGAVELLSTDHTIAEEMFRRGEITRERAATHRYANALTRVIGSQEVAEVDTLAIDVFPGDRFLLCSDGLTRYLEGLAELTAFLALDELESAPAELIQLANERGGSDNVTAVTVSLQASDAEERELAALGAEVQHRLDVLRSLDIFANASFVNGMRLLNECEVRDVAAGETVVGEEETCGQLCVILSGRFELVSGGRTLAELGPGDHVGDTTLLVDRPCTATLRALADGQMLVLRGADLRELARRRPWFGVAVLSTLAERLGLELAAVGELLAQSAGQASGAHVDPKPLHGFLFSRRPGPRH